MVTVKVTGSDGTSVEFDAPPAEYEAVLASTLRTIRDEQTSVVDERPSLAALQEMVEKLSDETLEYLRLLVEQPEGLSDHEIIDLLHLGDRRQKLAGMNGSITKTAHHAGISTEVIKRHVTRAADGSREYHYQVPSSVRTRLANVLPEDPEEPSEPPPPPTDDDVPF